MPDRELHVVTGAFGFSGRYKARKLLDRGHRVKTLAGSPPSGNSRLMDWARPNAGALGMRHAGELAPRRDRDRPCEAL